MEERRKSLRTELQAELLIKRLDAATGEKVTIHINDVSKGGIGFTCTETLDKGAYYEVFLTIWTKEVIHACVEIVRRDQIPDGYHYGGVFIGLTDLDCQRIEVYQIVEAYKN